MATTDPGTVVTFVTQGDFKTKVTDLPDQPSPAYTASQIKSYIQNPSDELKDTLNKNIVALQDKQGSLNIGAMKLDGTKTTAQNLFNDAQTRLTKNESDITSLQTTVADNDTRIDNIVASAGTSNTEIVDARYDSVNGTTYALLKDRLDNQSSQLADLSTNINNYKNYAIKTNGVITDWKPAIDKAISENSKIIFSNDIYPISDTIYIRKDIELNGNGATLQLNKTSGSFFRADDNTLTINSVKIYGFNIDSQVKSGTVSYNFFRADSKINELSIHHNHLKYTKLKIYNQSIFRIFKNRWEHDNTVYLDSNNEPYVNISLGVKDVNMVTTANNFIGTGIFEKNYFKIYAPTSTNFDMFACSGDSSEVTVQNNHFENTNITDAVCEIDTFTMGRKFKFLNNDLINVRIMRKQMQSSNTSTIEKTDYDLWEGNTIELSADNLVMDAAAYLAGSRFKFVNNTIICKATTITVGGASSSFSAIKLAATTYLSQSEKYDEFGQYTPTRYSILGNTIDLNDAPTTSIAFENVYNNGGTLPADFDSCSDHCSIIAINTIIGGYRLVSGSPKKVCLFGNVWTNIKSNGADGRGVLLGRGSTAIGNIITDGDRQPTIQGSDILNQASTFQANTVPYSTSDPNYDSANPNDVILDASVSNVFYLSSNVRVKSIVNGYAGQIIKLIAVDGTTSLKFDGTQSQDTLYLKGLADLALTRYSSVTLTKFATNSCWIELSRSTY